MFLCLVTANLCQWYYQPTVGLAGQTTTHYVAADNSQIVDDIQGDVIACSAQFTDTFDLGETTKINLLSDGRGEFTRRLKQHTAHQQPVRCQQNWLHECRCFLFKVRW